MDSPALPWWKLVLDAEYVGQHSFNTIQSVNLNSIDLGTAFLASSQDSTTAANATPGAASLASTNPDLLRSFQGYSTITQRFYNGWGTFHSVQLSLNRRFSNGFSFGFNDTMTLTDTAVIAPRLQHGAAGTYTVRSDQAQAQELLGDNNPRLHIMKANFVWDLPDVKSGGAAVRVLGQVVNDWQLSGIWTGGSGPAYNINFSYQSGGTNLNLTGSSDYAARIRVIGDPGNGCSGDVYRQFNTAAFQGPLTNSVGLESGTGYLRGCFTSTLDLSIARNLRLGRGRNIQLRVDLFNALNSAIITNQNRTLVLSSPGDPITNAAPVFDPISGLLNNGVNLTSTGAVSVNRSQPKNAGFGVATGYQAPRSVQGQIRFSF